MIDKDKIRTYDAGRGFDPSKRSWEESNPNGENFISGGVIYEDFASMPAIRKAVWEDPEVAEFIRTGKTPEWDIEELLASISEKKTKKAG